MQKVYSFGDRHVYSLTLLTGRQFVSVLFDTVTFLRKYCFSFSLGYFVVRTFLDNEGYVFVVEKIDQHSVKLSSNA